jgi:hypothetical protein
VQQKPGNYLFYLYTKKTNEISVVFAFRAAAAAAASAKDLSTSSPRPTPADPFSARSIVKYYLTGHSAGKLASIFY